MKISELLEAKLPKKSNLPSAPSLNDQPVDNVEDDLDDTDNSEYAENDDFEEQVTQFKKYGAEFGPDLYSFSSIEYFGDWNARNSTGLVSDVSQINLEGMKDAASAMRSASGYYGGMTFIIVNGRTGQAGVAGFGSDSISDGITMDGLEPDQVAVVSKINRLNDKYSNAGGGVEDEPSAALHRAREKLFELLNYPSQRVKSDKPATKIQGGDGPRSQASIDRAKDRRAARLKRLGITDDGTF